jgi:hypothetical protein
MFQVELLARWLLTMRTWRATTGAMSHRLKRQYSPMRIDDMRIQAPDIRSEEEIWLEMHIQARLSGRVRGIRVVRRDNGFVLQGQTPTYYAKQLVLHAAMQATTIPILVDEIEVGYVRDKRHMSCE